MGCGSSKIDGVQDSVSKKKVDKAQDIKVSSNDLVGEKMGRITNDYTLLLPALGKGAFGEVRKAVHKVTKQTRAVKIIPKKVSSQKDQDKLINEVNILKTLDHPNIIKVYEFYQDTRNFYIVTDLCTGGELFDKIIEEKQFSEHKAAETMKQILSAILYCHDNKIVHRDLKPENILYFTDTIGSVIKVVDFGTSRGFDPDKKMSQKIGTPYYIAPEVLENNYDEKCDVWSCGVILYILLSGKAPPFNGVTDHEILKAVKRGTFTFDDEEWKNVSGEAKILIAKMLTVDPKERISAREAIDDKWMRIYCEKPDVDLPQLAQSLKNMQTFRVKKKLQEASLIFMVNFLASQEEKNELLLQFKALDLNHDGKISRDELIIGYKRVLNEAEAEDEVDRIMTEVDKNQSGAIDFSGMSYVSFFLEFVLATINRGALMEQKRLQMAFKMFDKDGSGSITTDEIKMLFGTNVIISESVWMELIQEVDQNSDGKISYQEFSDMMVSKVMKST